jgi:putative DeoR family transcriptional regulator (stage III sporulation protein D)
MMTVNEQIEKQIVTKPENRSLLLGKYIIENKATVRATALKFGISKSTVHTVVT